MQCSCHYPRQRAVFSARESIGTPLLPGVVYWCTVEVGRKPGRSSHVAQSGGPMSLRKRGAFISRRHIAC